MDGRVQKIVCPGHTGKCKFCSGEGGRQRSIGGMPEITASGKPVVDPCCTICSNNMKYAKRKFGVYESSKLNYRVPKGDQL